MPSLTIDRLNESPVPGYMPGDEDHPRDFHPATLPLSPMEALGSAPRSAATSP